MPEEVAQRTELTIALTFFVLLTAFGLFLGGLAVQDFAQARASLVWPTTEGVVLSRNGKVGAPPMRYAYVAGGRTFESSRVRFITANFLAPKSTAPAPGETVIVRFSREDARLAVLQPGGSGGVFALILGLAGVLVFVGLAGLLRTLILSQSAEEATAARSGGPG
ncbi:MAG: DUF3592 domain-containing protein [Parvularculaceae bacterium]